MKLLPKVEECAKAVGGLPKLAELLGIERPSFYSWKNDIPPARVLDLERVTGISRHELRPDLYPREEGKAA